MIMIQMLNYWLHNKRNIENIQSWSKVGINIRISLMTRYNAHAIHSKYQVK